MNKEKQVALKKYPMYEQLLIKTRRLEEQNKILRKEVYKFKHNKYYMKVN